MERQDINKQIEQIVSMSEKGIIKNRINRITLKQFRGFEKESEINFKFPLSVVVGKNGSGKTTVLRMIQLLGKGNIPQNEFFEIDFDSGYLRGAEIEYYIEYNARQILGGSLSANQCRDYVLALLFLKSASEYYKSNDSFQQDDNKLTLHLLVSERSSFDYQCKALDTPDLGRLINMAL